MRQVWSCKTSKLPLRFRKFFFSKVTLFKPHFVTALWYTHTPVPLAILNQDSSGVVFVEGCVCVRFSPNGVVKRQNQAERSDRITQTGRTLSLAGVSPSAGGTTPSTCTSTCTSTTPSTTTSTTSTTTSGKAGRRSCLAPFPVCSTRFLCRWGGEPIRPRQDQL